MPRVSLWSFFVAGLAIVAIGLLLPGLTGGVRIAGEDIAHALTLLWPLLLTSTLLIGAVLLKDGFLLDKATASTRPTPPLTARTPERSRRRRRQSRG